MKKSIRKLIYKLNKNPLSKALYKREVNSRSKLALTDIEALSKRISMFAPFTSELQPVNDWYSHAGILKKFLGLPEDYKFKFIIEHGLYLSDQVADIELESNLPTFITYSPFRVKVLKKYRSYAYAIGPLIHYASQYLSDQELANEKKRLNKTLLFFPSHSLLGLTNDYDMEWSYQRIKYLAKGFNTIRICLYWRDILLGKHKYYQSKGFECVTAGHILDPLFLSRLKSIINIADLTASNDASSPLSYCIYMDKPHIIFYQRPQMTGQKYLKKVMTDYWRSEPYNQIIKEFSTIRLTISPRQRELMNYYCGTNSVKNKKQLRKIVDEAEKVYQQY